jgi:hypothetical protein
MTTHWSIMACKKKSCIHSHLPQSRSGIDVAMFTRQDSKGALATATSTPSKDPAHGGEFIKN